MNNLEEKSLIPKACYLALMLNIQFNFFAFNQVPSLQQLLESYFW